MLTLKWHKSLSKRFRLACPVYLPYVVESPRIRTGTGLFTLEAIGCCDSPFQTSWVCIPCYHYTKTPKGVGMVGIEPTTRGLDWLNAVKALGQNYFCLTTALPIELHPHKFGGPGRTRTYCHSLNRRPHIPLMLLIQISLLPSTIYYNFTFWNSSSFDHHLKKCVHFVGILALKVFHFFAFFDCVD